MQLFLTFPSVPAFSAEIESNLSKGRAFVSGVFELEERELCELILVHPETQEWMPLEAEAVYFLDGAQPGVGVELKENPARLRELFEAFIAEPQEPESEQVVPSSELTPSSRPVDSKGLALSPAERVRGLDVRGRERMARKGTLAERVALERAYGATVWEALLNNPMLTGPEVARVAKNRTISQPILNQLMANSAWLGKAEVRRALLSNPRLSDVYAERVLRALPLAELKLVPRQGSYPAKVRSIAKRLLPTS